MKKVKANSHYFHYALIILGALSFIVLFSNFKESMSQHELNEALKKNNAYVKKIENDYKILAKNINLLLFQKPEVLKLVKKAYQSDEGTRHNLRIQLYNTLKEEYTELKKLSFRQVHFHFPDNTSFLRMHKLDKFGDDLSKVRYSVALTNKEKIFVHGFEEGRIVNGFRYVFPLSDPNDASHIGSVEASVTSYGFVQQLESFYEAHAHFIIKKEIVDTTLWDDSKRYFYAQSKEHPHYYRELNYKHDHDDVSQQHDYENEKIEVQKYIGKGEAYTFYENKKIVTLLPIRDIKNKTVNAYFVIYTNGQAILHLEILFWIATLIVIAFSSVLFYLTLQQHRKWSKSQQTNSKLEGQLGETIEELKQAQKIAKLGSWKLTYPLFTIECSIEVLHTFGFKKQQISFFEYFRMIHPEDIESVKKALKASQHCNMPQQFTHRIITPENIIKYIEIYFQTYFDVSGRKLISEGTFQDISERSSHELKLRDSVQKYKNAIQTLNEQKFALDEHAIVSITDIDGLITYTNEKFIALMGYASDELLGKNHKILSSNTHEHSFWKEMYETISEGNPWHGQVCNHTKEGEKIWLDTTIVPFMNNNGLPKSYIAIRTNITKQIQSAQTLRERDIQLMQQSRLAQMGEMISMIAHQWRQPLAAIAATSLDIKLKIEFDRETFHEKENRDIFLNTLDADLNDINSFVNNLTSTIDDFRNFYKPQKNKEYIAPSHVIQKALKIVQNILSSEGISIKEEYKSTKKLSLHSNEIIQVILNIIKNAQDNFLEKNISDGIITIKTFDQGNTTTVSIYDNGGGIPSEILPNIFEPYFSTKKKKNGTGLGLYMSKTIIEEHHNGNIIAKNTENGVCFTINFEWEEKS